MKKIRECLSVWFPEEQPSSTPTPKNPGSAPTPSVVITDRVQIFNTGQVILILLVTPLHYC